ncbi:uncharacterized protein LOC128931483 [Callithrix jacchus]
MGGAFPSTPLPWRARAALGFGLEAFESRSRWRRSGAAEDLGILLVLQLQNAGRWREAQPRRDRAAASYSGTQAECSDMIMAYCSLDLLYWGDPPASASQVAGTTAAYHHIQLTSREFARIQLRLQVTRRD